MAASWISAAGIILALLHLAGEWRSSSDDDSRALSPTRRNMAARTLDFRQILFVFSFSSSLSLTTRKSVSSSVEYNVSCESRTAHACVRRSASVGTRTRSFGVGIPGTARSRSARPAASHLIDRDRRPSYPYDCSLFTRYEKYMFYYKYFRKQRNKFYRKNRNTQRRKNKMFLNEWKKTVVFEVNYNALTEPIIVFQVFQIGLIFLGRNWEQPTRPWNRWLFAIFLPMNRSSLRKLGNSVYIY